MSEAIDVSILIVHTFEGKLLRQTLRGLRRAAPKIRHEIIVIDNNPAAGFSIVLEHEFPDVKHLLNETNKGFGGAMNVGIKAAKGRYILVFNPDIVIHPGSLEELMQFMDQNPEVGVCGPQLLDPNGELQFSCYRIPTLLIPVYRRTPLGQLPVAKRAVDHYMMADDDHSQTMEVDSLIGAALFTRREALDDVGLFDERFFMYYEDNDLCRRFWEKGYKVIYHPTSKMTHYHRRQSADGNLFNQLTSRFTWIHIHSFIKYYLKYRKQTNPREIKEHE